MDREFEYSDTRARQERLLLHPGQPARRRPGLVEPLLGRGETS